MICHSEAVKRNYLWRIWFLFCYLKKIFFAVLVFCRIKNSRHERDTHTYQALAVKPWGSDIFTVSSPDLLLLNSIVNKKDLPKFMFAAVVY